MLCVTMKKAIEATESGMKSNEVNIISDHQQEELTTLAAPGPPKINHRWLPIVNFRYLSASPWTRRSKIRRRGWRLVHLAASFGVQ